MSYKFDLDGLDNNEIVNILNELKRKKKYYKLKSGDLISLEENDGLKELNSLIDSMDLSEKDIKKGHGVIPKYKAIRGMYITEEPLIKTTTNKIKRQANLDRINAELQR